jgi:hypothetical protein
MSPRPGIPYVLFRVGPGCSAKIGEYYTKTLGACSVQVDETTVAVAAGANSLLLFVESAVDAAAVTQQEGLHLCIYITDFEASYSRVTPWTNPKVSAVTIEDNCRVPSPARAHVVVSR